MCSVYAASSRYAAWATRWRVPLGFAFGVTYLALSQPTPRLLVAGAAIALLGLCWRGLAAGYLEKNSRLATGGPYAYTRNPLYLGSALIGAGFALASHSWLIGAAFVILFPLVYWPVIRREEGFLRAEFGEAYQTYARQVPLWCPAPARSASSGERFRWERYRKNREYEAAVGYLAVMAFLAIKMALR